MDCTKLAIGLIACSLVASAARANDVLRQRYLQWDAPARVEKVTVGGEEVTISGSTGKAKGKLFLAEFPIEGDAWRPATFTWRRELDDRGRFEVTLPRRVSEESGQRDRLLARWAVLSERSGATKLVSTARYADEVTASGSLPPHPPLRSKKGLGGFDARRKPLSDIDDLGISTITVNLSLGFMARKPRPDSTPFEYNGKTFHASNGIIRRFDATLQFAEEKQLLVFGILLVPKPGARKLDPNNQLAHPDCDPSANFAMPDVTSPGGVELYGASLAYLIDRYSGAGGHGRIHHWIVHNEVDAGVVWTNAGDKTMPHYMDLYHKSMRMVHLLASDRDPQSKAFISLTHSWAAPSERRFYASRPMLDLLNAYGDAEGDFEWGVAYHPYPQSLRKPATWNDARAKPRADSPLITFKNIEVLAAWAREPRNRFARETVRDLYLTEQGFNSPDYSQASLRLQAAGMAYAWKKIADLPEILGMHYHNWIDNRHEGGLRIGLRRFPDDERGPNGRKPIWRVYKNAGGPDEDKEFQFALPIIGIKSWDEIDRPKPQGRKRR